MNKQFLSNLSFRLSISLLLLGIVFTGITTFGCGSTETPVAIENPATVTPKVTVKKTETVIAANESQVESPAKNPIKLPEVDASPESVCEIFMQYLNSGERVKAERLLSSTALSTTAVPTTDRWEERQGQNQKRRLRHRQTTPCPSRMRHHGSRRR